MENYLTAIKLCLSQIEILKEKGGSEKEISNTANYAKKYIDTFVKS